MVTRRTRRHPAVPATMSAADFKARCLELMDSVERTGRSVVVTKRGRPVAVLAPIRERRASAHGFMKGRIQILGDIVAPVDVDWDAER
ncbi:MAG TPA: type II toxin-antitoxin system Phd/YefM family antitoxin [Kofleriaceae bacterium]